MIVKKKKLLQANSKNGAPVGYEKPQPVPERKPPQHSSKPKAKGHSRPPSKVTIVNPISYSRFNRIESASRVVRNKETDVSKKDEVVKEVPEEYGGLYECLELSD